jgi:flavodoxin
MKRAIVFAVSAVLLFLSGNPAIASNLVTRTGGKMDKKILVVYYSKTGHTERVAKDIASGLGADTEKLIDKKDRSGFLGYIMGGRDAAKKRTTEIEKPLKNPKDYDVVIIGTPVWAWNMTPAVRTYLSAYKNDFKNVAFFTTAGGTKPEKIVRSMEDLAGKKGLGYVGFVQKELKDQDVYSNKLSDFFKLFK